MKNKILIIQQKMIGDVLMTSVLAEIIKKNHPHYHIDYLVESHTQDVVVNNPFIDKLIVIEKGSLHKWSNLFALCRRVHKQKYDIVINVYGKLSGMFLTVFSGASMKIGKHKWYGRFIYHHSVKYFPKKYSQGLQHIKRVQLLEPLGIKYTSIFPKIYLTDKERENGILQIRKKEHINQFPIFMISLLGSNHLKSYPKDYMASLLDHIVKKTDCFLLFNYIPSQEKEAFEIFDLCSTEVRSRFVLDLHQKGLREFIALLSICKAIIGNEGGAINMAKAISIPSFAIFAPWHAKEHWNHMENGTTHISVHLKDYKPELFSNVKKLKHLKTQSNEYYSHFKPELMLKQLDHFLKINS